MDRTTLTRNLEVMQKQGLVNVSPGEDKRTRIVSITESGISTLLEAYPLWLSAQTQIAESMQDERMERFLSDIHELIQFTQKT